MANSLSSSSVDASEGRRHHHRYPAYFHATLTRFGEREIPVPAFIANVSQRGTRAVTPIAFHPGQVVKLQIDDTELVGDVAYSFAEGDYFCTGVKLQLPVSGAGGISNLLRAMWIEPIAADIATHEGTSKFMTRTGSRRHLRYSVSGTVRILWQDADGGEGILRAKIENASEMGAKLRLDKMIPVRSYVSCNDESLGIGGTGSVRYCRFVKGKYDVGLEFRGGSGWRKPGDTV